MTGQLLTSFKNSVAMGSYQATATTIPNLINELRYSSGCAGSFSLGTAYTLSGVTIPTGWYNFLYIPHRSGGVNGQANGDNTNYGSLLLSGMTVSGCYIVRYSSSSIAEVRNVYQDNNSTYPDAIKNITRSGTTFTATRYSGSTFTFTQQDNNTTYGVASTSANGLMSSADKTKLNKFVPASNVAAVDFQQNNNGIVMVFTYTNGVREGIEFWYNSGDIAITRCPKGGTWANVKVNKA